MLAGVGPAPAVLFVVAADEGWMPQSAEHLAALDALGVGTGCSRSPAADLADPAPALAPRPARGGRTSLGGAPRRSRSGATGAGLDELRAALPGSLGRSRPPTRTAASGCGWTARSRSGARAPWSPARWPAGTVRVGDRLELDGDVVRVRGVESLGRTSASVSGVARVALALAPPVPGGLGRGSALTTPGAFEMVTEVDVRVRGEGAVPDRPLLHLGSAHIAVLARPLDDTHAPPSARGPTPPAARRPGDPP